MPRPVSVRFEVVLAVCVLLTGAIVVGLVIAAEKQPLDAEDMKIDAADLGSYAGEGELLARQRIGVSITHNYSNVQGEMWRDEIEEIVRKYESREPAADLTDSFQEVRALAQRLKAAAERAPTISAAELKGVAADARQLKARLASRSELGSQ